MNVFQLVGLLALCCCALLGGTEATSIASAANTTEAATTTMAATTSAVATAVETTTSAATTAATTTSTTTAATTTPSTTPAATTSGRTGCATVSPACTTVGEDTTFFLSSSLPSSSCNSVSITVNGQTSVTSMSSLSTFSFTPSVSGVQQIDITCQDGSIVFCASVYASVPSATITVSFTGTAPSSADDQATFKQKFAQSCATAADLDVSQIVDITIIGASTRRDSHLRAAAAATPSTGFSVGFAVLGSATSNSSASAAAVVAAAKSGALNSAISSNFGSQYSLATVGEAGSNSTTVGPGTATSTKSGAVPRVSAWVGLAVAMAMVVVVGGAVLV